MEAVPLGRVAQQSASGWLHQAAPQACGAAHPKSITLAIGLIMQCPECACTAASGALRTAHLRETAHLKMDSIGLTNSPSTHFAKC